MATKQNIIEERYIRRNSTEPFGLVVSKGSVRGHSYVHKFGAVPAMSQNQSGSIWDINDTNYPWSSFSSAGTLSIPAVNASDNDETMVIVGLDSDYKEITETVTLNSSAAVTTTNSFIRVYRAYMTSGTNVGNVDIQKGGTTVARITAAKGQTLMAIYTVPAGHTAYLMQGTATCQDGGDASMDMFVRYGGQDAFRIGHSFEITGEGGQYLYPFATPIKIPEKSDIDIRAKMRSNNSRITTAFDIILVNESNLSS